MDFLKELKEGKCPFTGKPYDCANCKDKFPTAEFPTVQPPPGKKFVERRHMGLYIRQGVEQGEAGWRRTLSFIDGDPKEMRRELEKLIELGVHVLPINEKCDKWCYRDGCHGHIVCEDIPLERNDLPPEKRIRQMDFKFN